MEWNARLNYLKAKNEIRTIEMYTQDLVWRLVKAKYEGSFPMPSELWEERHTKDNRSAKQIINDVLEKLGGE